MSRKSAHKSAKPSPPAARSKKSASRPDFPQHELPEPFYRLQILGIKETPELYEEIAAQLLETDPAGGAATLLKMVQDETYYDYDPTEIFDPATSDPRSWSRTHALRTLAQMGEHANPAIEPLLPLLNDEDDWLREEAPFFYASMGQPAIAPLIRVLLDENAEPFQRGGASDALTEIGEEWPELQGEILPVLEKVLSEEQDEMLVGFMIINLMDLGAKDSLPLIELAYQEERVDESLVQLYEVQQHFDVPVTAPRKRWTSDGEELVADADDMVGDGIAGEDDDFEDEADGEEEPVSVPYVAPVKVGRNEPCPCGSGKKYKKCCGQ